MVLRRAGDRIGARFAEPEHRMGDGEEEGDMVVRQEGASPVVVGGKLW